MSTSTSSSKRKSKKVVLNGKFKAYDDTTGYNRLQLMHHAGEIDVYAEIHPDIPSIAEQWKEDYRKRTKNGKSARNR